MAANNTCASRYLTSACLQALSNCLLGFATLDHTPEETVLVAVQQHLVAHAALFSTQAITNCLWALALLHALPPPTWNALIRAYLGMLGPGQSLSGEQGQHLISHHSSSELSAQMLHAAACNDFLWLSSSKAHSLEPVHSYIWLLKMNYKLMNNLDAHTLQTPHASAHTCVVTHSKDSYSN